MNGLVAYRDDGPLATQLARLLGNSPKVPAPLVMLIGGVVLTAGLVTAGQGVAVPALGTGIGLYVLVAGIAAGEELTGRFDWVVPPLLRAAEYTTLLVLALLARPTDPWALPACFALVAVLAYNHYNATYRLRYQSAVPPRWLRYVGGGWDVRLLVTFGLFAAGWLAIGMYLLAGALAVLYVTETVISWRRVTYAHSTAIYEEEEDEAE